MSSYWKFNNAQSLYFNELICLGCKHFTYSWLQKVWSICMVFAVFEEIHCYAMKDLIVEKFDSLRLHMKVITFNA
jgi:hypothetical protein